MYQQNRSLNFDSRPTSYRPTNHRFVEAIASGFVISASLLISCYSLPVAAYTLVKQDSSSWTATLPATVPPETTQVLGAEVESVQSLASAQTLAPIEPGLQQPSTTLLSSAANISAVDTTTPSDSAAIAPQAATASDPGRPLPSLEFVDTLQRASLHLLGHSTPEPASLADPLMQVDAIFPERQAVGGRYWAVQQLRGLMETLLLQAQIESETEENRPKPELTHNLFSDILPEPDGEIPPSTIGGIVGAIALVIFQLGRGRN